MDAQANKESYTILIKALFRPAKTIRDAVHGDIKLSTLEINIIDTKTFQRLRDLKQLGTTSLVYPCASHTRFEHSLGALFMAKRIIDIVNSNPHNKITIDPYEILLIRLSALLHDVSNIPFGHTLEDEGKLLEGQWKDEKRLDFFLGEDQPIGKVLQKDPILIDLNKLGHKDFKPINVLNDLKKVLSAIEKKETEDLPKPFIADIVGNTLCADLLDYVRRDFYFTGLKGNYDDRFLSFLYVDKIPIKKETKGAKQIKKPRLILRLARPTSGRMRKDVLSELLHLLRMRYSLAEKVYYHHAKISSSAMVISATNDVMINNKLKPEEMYELGDNLFLQKLIDDEYPIAKTILSKLLIRQLYKPIYGLKYSEGTFDSSPEAQKKKRLVEMLWQNPRNRWEIERQLEQQNSLDPGYVVVYCPGRDMGYKAVKALVNLGNDEIGPLDKILPQRVKEEVRTSITQKHFELWTMFVFVEPNVNKIDKINIYGDCVERFELQNEIPECNEYLSPNWMPYYERLEEKRAKERGERRLLSEEINLIIEKAALQEGQNREKQELQRLDYDKYSKLVDEYISNK